MGVLAKRLRKVRPHKREVGAGLEFRRIAALPRRSFVEDLRVPMTEWLKTPNGTMQLNFEQAWALAELYEHPGLLAHLEPGAGKTLISLLAPTVVQRRWEDEKPGEMVRAALIVPANLRNHKTLKQDVPFYGKHFDIYDWHEDNVLSYEQMGREDYADVLESRMFNMLVFDEVHKIKNVNAAVSIRVMRYLQRYPDTVVVALTGTLAKESLRNFGHISRIALDDKSPLPLSDGELDVWARALDHDVDEDSKYEPGALQQLCAPGESVEEGFRRRLAETPNVVISRESELDVGLIIRERPLSSPPPEVIGRLMREMVKTQRTPSDDIIVSALEMSRHRKELACGFYYRWLWPNDQPDLEWLAARREWRRFVRKCIRNSGTSKVANLLLDSEKQVRTAVEGGSIRSPNGEYENWAAIEKRCDPQLQAVWVDEFLIDEIVRWVQESDEPGLVWVQHNAILNKLRKRGLIVYGGGQDEVVYETRTCVVSLEAHKEGKNLQAFSRNLYVTPPMSGLAWEQSMARTHRQQQKASEVSVEVFLHCMDFWTAFRHARSESAWVSRVIGSKPRLERATIDIPLEDEVISRSRQGDPLWVV